MKTEVDWHVRFIQQAGWSRNLRKYLYKKVNLGEAGCILEVGCGTGAILDEIPSITGASIHAVDLDHARLLKAMEFVPSVNLTMGDALSLSYPRLVFDVTYCHFLLMWVSDPLQALMEMRRVTRHGGAILVMAEPDYSHRNDPSGLLTTLGKMQAFALQDQGADPEIGAKLPQLFQQAGIQLMETGILEKRKPVSISSEEWDMEWAVLEYDLAGCIPEATMADLKRKFSRNREDFFFVPIHFAWGWV
jgi:SAM-dependent methyltransferase